MSAKNGDRLARRRSRRLPFSGARRQDRIRDAFGVCALRAMVSESVWPTDGGRQIEFASQSRKPNSARGTIDSPLENWPTTEMATHASQRA
jgi:hypothetical protein